MATYYVSSTGGTGAGTIGDPWSLSHALNTASSGLSANDIVYVMADGTYSLSASTDFGAAGTLDGVNWFGVNSVGVEDGTRVLIQASSSIVGAMCSVSNNTNLPSFTNIVFDANSNADNAFSVEEHGVQFVRCDFTGAISHGIVGNDPFNLDYCNVYSNGGDGVNGSRVSAYRTKIANNSGNGLVGSVTLSSTTARQCVISGNGADGAVNTRLIDCVVHDNGDEGVFTTAGISVFGTVVSANAGFGFQDVSMAWCAYGSGASANGTLEFSSVSLTPLVDAGAAPYRDAADTPPDYRIPSSSPLDGAGVRFAESLWGSTDTRGGIGIGDFEPASGGGGGISGSPLSNPFIRV